MYCKVREWRDKEKRTSKKYKQYSAWMTKVKPLVRTELLLEQVYERQTSWK